MCLYFSDFIITIKVQYDVICAETSIKSQPANPLKLLLCSIKEMLLLLFLLALLKSFAEFLWLGASKDNHCDKLKQVFDAVLSPNQHC